MQQNVETMPIKEQFSMGPEQFVTTRKIIKYQMDPVKVIRRTFKVVPEQMQRTYKLQYNMNGGFNEAELKKMLQTQGMQELQKWAWGDGN
ncbi:hypothetical protein OSTOST_00453 [Ostertagia ostertagi]